jgi:hypothetical protein
MRYVQAYPLMWRKEDSANRSLCLHGIASLGAELEQIQDLGGRVSLENFNLSWASSGPRHTSSIHQLSSFEGTLWGTPHSRLCMIEIKNSNTKILVFVLKMVAFFKKVISYSIVLFNFQGKFVFATIMPCMLPHFLVSCMLLIWSQWNVLVKLQLRVDQHGARSWVSHQKIKSPHKCWDQCSPHMRRSVLGSAPCSVWIFMT